MQVDDAAQNGVGSDKDKKSDVARTAMTLRRHILHDYQSVVTAIELCEKRAYPPQRSAT